MNKQEYNNVIETTIAQQTGEKDSLQTTREVLNNMGVVLPQGNLQQVSEGLATDDYMGWRKCSVKEAQEYVNEGIAVVAVSDDQIALVAANDEDGEVVANSSAVMTLDENTSALAVADMVFYANSRARTSIISYCGGANYQDVTQHSLVYHKGNGMYICSKCGYCFLAPESEDWYILSPSDYIQVTALLHYYSQNKLLAANRPLSAYFYNSEANNAKIMIDTIRSKASYASQYDFKGPDGKYFSSQTNANYDAFVHLSTINYLTIGSYNGVYESIGKWILAYYCPPVAALVDVISLVTEPMDLMEFGSFSADLLDLNEVSMGLDLASTILGVVTCDIEIGDRVVYISFNAYAHAEYIFSANNEIKECRIFYSV